MAQSSELQIVLSAIDKTTAEIKKVQSSLNGLGKTSENTGISFTKMAGAVALGNLAYTAISKGVSMLTGFLKESVNAFSENQVVAAQLNAVLKSTGGVAGITAEKATELSKSFQNLTTFSDEAVLSAENLLLTFTNIKGSTFEQATSVVLDMSVALGQDLKSSAIQVGKALQDPILGVTALRRVGVNFNEDQQKVIKTLVETGKGLEAQQMILAELNKEFGGSAAAKLNTYAGAWEHLKNIVDDFQEGVGAVIIGVLQQILTKVGEFVTFLNDGWKAITEMWKTNADGIRDKTQAVFQTILEIVIPVWNAVGAAILKGWQLITVIWQQYGQSIVNIFLSAWKLIADTLKNAFIILGDIFSIATDILTGNWKKFADDLGKIFQDLWNGIVDLAKNGAGLLMEPVNWAIKALNKITGTDVKPMKLDFGVLDQLKFKMEDTTEGVKKQSSEIANALTDIFGKAFSGATVSGSAAGANLLPDFGSGGQVDKVKDKLKDLTDQFNSLKTSGTESLESLRVELEKNLKTLNDKLHDLTISYGKVKSDLYTDLMSLKIDHQKALQDITDSISDAKAKLDELRASFSQETTGRKNTVAEAIVAAEDKIDELKEKMKDVTDVNERAQIQKQIDEQQRGLSNSASFITSIQDQVNEARRRASLSEVERAIEDFNTQQTLAQQAFDIKQRQIQQEIDSLQAKRRIEESDYLAKVQRTQAEADAKMVEINTEIVAAQLQKDQEIALYMEKSAEIQKLMTDAYAVYDAIVANNKKLTLDAVNAQISAYKSLEEQIKKTASAQASSLIPSNLRAYTPYAEGGIVTKPTYALVGEAGPEAIIPLRGATSNGYGQVVININGGTYLSESVAVELGDKIIKRLKQTLRI